MRKLPLLLVLLLLSLMLLAAAASAHAAGLPPLGDPFPLAAAAGDEEGDESEAEAGEDEEAESEEGEACGPEEEAEEPCEEVDESEEAEQCVVEDASAAVTIGANSDQVRLTIRYRSSEPATVAIDTSLRGGKGSLHLGSDHARFGRAGAFHGSFRLDRKQMSRALAAREFEIDLHAVGTPADCELRLATRGSRRAR